MTLKQRLAELLPHFDDEGNILPNKIITFRMAHENADPFKSSNVKNIAELLRCLSEGNEYRIEDAPKRPREVWFNENESGINFDDPHETKGLAERFATKTNADKFIATIRFIEDTPREVTDADAEYYWDYYKPSSDETIKQAFKRMLQHYEQERLK